eukprot:m.170150 g.170150  ORF g.170150 m.170150 type:complete len:260 (-) comp13487_c0_seq12:29-808(-)
MEHKRVPNSKRTSHSKEKSVSSISDKTTTTTTSSTSTSTLFCVLDFEATCQDGVKGWRNEIIEFPSVLYRYDHSSESLEKVDEIQRFCTPQYINGEGHALTTFCKNLTGITQQQVDDGEDFPSVLKEYSAWLDRHRQTFATSNGDGKESEGTEKEDVVFVTCGNWDLKSMLPQECERWGLKVPGVFKRFINIKQWVGKALGKRVRGMPSMLSLCGLTMVGRHHSGIDDCINIGRALEKMSEWGFIKDNAYENFLFKPRT